LKKKLKRSTISSIRNLGIYQVAGGIFGIGFLIWATIANKYINYFFILPVLFYSYSILCGVLCINTHNSSLTHSLINQFLQLVGFAILGYGVEYVSGIFFDITFNLTDSFDLNWRAGLSTFNLNINSNPSVFILDLNFIALAIIFWILKLSTKVNQEFSLQEVSGLLEKDNSI
jgi:hypothetical protein